jgi:glycosyltransferase involved in cell wall biosynthesis
VTVVIPCHNHGHYLTTAITSILSQSYSHVEVIVVDDGSTDDTSRVARSYGDPVRCIRQENAGLPAARNTGLLQATGEFVLFLDADDYLRPDALEHHLRAVDATPAADVFHGAVDLEDSEGRVVTRLGGHPLGDDAFHAILASNVGACHALLVRRSAFANAGIFDVSLRSCEDWDMWLRLAAAGSAFVAVPDAVAVYRRYDGSMSTNVERMWQAGRQVLRKIRHYHGNCRRCRRAMVRGAIAHGRWCCRLLESGMASAGERGKRGAAIVRASRVMVRTPALGCLLLSEWWRRSRH